MYLSSSSSSEPVTLAPKLLNFPRISTFVAFFEPCPAIACFYLKRWLPRHLAAKVLARALFYLHPHFENHAELRAVRCRFVFIRHLDWMNFCLSITKLHIDFKRDNRKHGPFLVLLYGKSLPPRPSRTSIMTPNVQHQLGCVNILWYT